MGRDKSKLEHPLGGTFLSHATNRLTTICDQVCIAGRADVTGSVPVLADPVAFRGPATGVAVSLQFAAGDNAEGCLVTPIDMPFLTSDDLLCLRQAWFADPEKLVCGVSSTSGQVQPLVAIYPTQFRFAVCRLAQSERRGLYRWITRQDYVGVPLSEHACRNINSPEDLSSGPEVSI